MAGLRLVAVRKKVTPKTGERELAKSATSMPPELRKLAQEVGELMHHWGLKRVHGRVWTLLFLAEQPLSAASIVRSLKISKGLVSLTLRELVTMGLALVSTERTAAGRRTYRANADVHEIVLALVSSRQKSMMERIGSTLYCLLSLPGSELKRARVTKDRLAELGATLGKKQNRPVI